MQSVDVFVYLDDVQFARKTWQSKNRIRENGRVRTIEVPVVKAPLATPIMDIYVDADKPWAERHRNLIRASYACAPFAEQACELLEATLSAPPAHLVDICIKLIEQTRALLAIPTRTLRASDLNCGGKRSDHVAAICKAVGATHYLSPEGARAYLEEDRFAERNELQLAFQAYEPMPYPQSGGGSFESHLSIVDVIAELGADGASHYVRTGQPLLTSSTRMG